MEKNRCEHRVVGAVDSRDLEDIKLRDWDLLDLSRALFESNADEPVAQGVVSHGRTMAFRPKKTEPLLDLLSSIHAVRVVLPATVSRKQLNAAIRNTCIYQIEVLEDCPLFTMKDGDVWNKKGTILFYKQQNPEYIPCGECGKMIVSTDAIVSSEGTVLCQECLKKYHYCDSCFKYFRKDNPNGPKERVGRCRECIEWYGVEE